MFERSGCNDTIIRSVNRNLPLSQAAIDLSRLKEHGVGHWQHDERTQVGLKPSKSHVVRNAL
jgi:hypothetical protein